MDPFERSTAALFDMARAHIADAAEMNEISENLRTELLERSKMIADLKNECDQRRVQAAEEALRSFRFGFLLGGIAAGAFVSAAIFLI